MPVFMLSQDLVFPPPECATPEGVIALGGDLSPERLLLAYAHGIFPWPHQGYPLLWFSPDPRFVLGLNHVKVSRSLRKTIRRGIFEIRTDTEFERVIKECATVPRPEGPGTWITEEIVKGYTSLHEKGFAHSVEAWCKGELVGGLYGVSIGRVFTGESMFTRVSNASKVAAVTLFGNLKKEGFSFVDCQVYTEHLARFGAEEWPRKLFLKTLSREVRCARKHEKWTFSLNPRAALDLLLERAQ
jgi:leucyl/phenylalanyl-tRNA--protein transferase